MSERKSENLKQLLGKIEEESPKLVLTERVVQKDIYSFIFYLLLILHSCQYVNTASCNEISGEEREITVKEGPGTTLTDVQYQDSKENKNRPFQKPHYSKPIHITGNYVQISYPIFVNKDTEGILLDPGFYKIEYTTYNIKQYHGFGLFNIQKKEAKFAGYIIQDLQKGHFYLDIEEQGVLAIIAKDHSYQPQDTSGDIVFTVHQYMRMFDMCKHDQNSHG